LILEYSGLSHTGYYISEEMMTCAVLLEDAGYVVAGDQSGSLRLFLPRNKHKALSEALKRNVYKATHISEVTDQKRHHSEVCFLRSTRKGTDFFSADKSGRIMSWQVIAKKGTFEISPINLLDLNGQINFFHLDDTSSQLFVGRQGDICQVSSSVTPSTPVTSRAAQHTKAAVTSVYCTSLDVMMAGYANGDVQLFVDIHKDAVLKLPHFTDNPVLLVFPGNYSKMDKVSRKITVMECLASIHALDDKGKLFIFDIEDKIDAPEKTLDVITEDKAFTILETK
jgi:hypothetical protein